MLLHSASNLCQPLKAHRHHRRLHSPKFSVASAGSWTPPAWSSPPSSAYPRALGLRRHRGLARLGRLCRLRRLLHIRGFGRHRGLRRFRHLRGLVIFVVSMGLVVSDSSVVPGVFAGSWTLSSSHTRSSPRACVLGDTTHSRRPQCVPRQLPPMVSTAFIPTPLLRIRF